MNIVVIDYGIGNINSIINMLLRLGVKAVCSRETETLYHADKFILPGVGAFDHGMMELTQSGILPLLNELVLLKKKPLLGICLGMQLLLNYSTEGKLPGLGWLSGHCKRFQITDTTQLKIPHMGWNHLHHKKSHPLLKNMEETPRFYFVHSYHAVCDNDLIIGESHHGYEFPAIIGKDHIIGAQFHPEKSHRYGMQFLKNFLEFETC